MFDLIGVAADRRRLLLLELVVLPLALGLRGMRADQGLKRDDALGDDFRRQRRQLFARQEVVARGNARLDQL